MSKSVCEPDRKSLTKRLPDRTCEMCARDSACDDTINWQYFFLKNFICRITSQGGITGYGSDRIRICISDEPASYQLHHAPKCREFHPAAIFSYNN